MEMEDRGKTVEGVAYEDETGEASPETQPERWAHWVLGVYFGVGLLLYGVTASGVWPLILGYLIVPTAMYLDLMYVREVTDRWQPDVWMYVLTTVLFLLLMVPVYLYHRNESVGLL